MIIWNALLNYFQKLVRQCREMRNEQLRCHYEIILIFIFQRLVTTILQPMHTIIVYPSTTA